MADAELELSAVLARMADEVNGPYRGWDAVNPAMIRHWCEAMGDNNPIYTDRDRAAGSIHGELVAPPAMLQAWTMRGYENRFAPGSSDKEPFAILAELEKAGYPAVVAVNCEQEYLQYLKCGDELYHTSRIESVSEEKTTALGVGFFVTELSEYFNQRDEKVGSMRFRVFKYRPHQQAGAEPVQAPAKPAAVKRMRPVRSYDTAYFWEGVDCGELRIQRCTSCGALRHPPGPMCPSCQSLDWEAITASGRGTIFSFVVMHYPQIPPFDYPNPVVLIELEEGVRLISQIVGVKGDDLHIGAAVQVEFNEVEEGLRLPQFRLVEET